MAEEKCLSKSYSIEPDNLLWLEGKKEGERSNFVNKGLKLVQMKENRGFTEEIALAILIILVGVTLWFFALVLYPFSESFTVLMVLGVVSIIGGYFGVYAIYKRGIPGGI